MSDTLLTTISRLASRPEKFVVILPSGEAVVLVPLSEYEKLTASSASVPVKPSNSPATSIKKAIRNEANSVRETVEAIDPIPGGVVEDDQYFPEPLE